MVGISGSLSCSDTGRFVAIEQPEKPGSLKAEDSQGDMPVSS
jgi:hypothetical protein